MKKHIAIVIVQNNVINLYIYRRTSRLAFELIINHKNYLKESDEDDRITTKLSSLIDITREYKVYKKFIYCDKSYKSIENLKQKIKNKKYNISLITQKKEIDFISIANKNLIADRECSIMIYIHDTDLKIVDINKSLVIDIDELANYNYDSYKNILIKSDIFDSLITYILNKIKYPIKDLHNYICTRSDLANYINDMENSDNSLYQNININEFKNTLIQIQSITEKLNIKNLINSRVGIPEGILIKSINSKIKSVFPKNFCIDSKRVLDKFSISEKLFIEQKKIALKILNILKKEYNLYDYEKVISIASTLLNIGDSIDSNNSRIHSGYIVINSFKYNLTHEQIALIYILISSSKSTNLKDFDQFKDILPQDIIVEKLHFIILLTEILSSQYLKTKDIDISYVTNTLDIKVSKNSKYIEINTNLYNYINKIVKTKINII